MQKSQDSLARAYALEILSPLNQLARINKEKLFADAVAYYRWLLADVQAPEALDVYWDEFQAHHKSLLAGVKPDVRIACFITWFVEQHFHAQAPLARASSGSSERRHARLEDAHFSSPSFRLPTGDPVESYLIQWLYWHLDHLPAPGESVDKALLSRWAEGMVYELLEQHELSSDEIADLFKCAALFFSWCRRHLRTWDTFLDLFIAFLRSEPGQTIDQADTPLADACFVTWLCQHSRFPPGDHAPATTPKQEHSVSTEE